MPEWTVFLLSSNYPNNAPPAKKKKQVLKFIRAFSELIDDNDELIRMAVERYFIALLEENPANPMLSFSYSEKAVIGIQAGLSATLVAEKQFNDSM